MLHARRFAAAAAAALAVSVPDALAQWKPTRPVDVVVHTAPGGGSDVLARAMVQMLEKEGLMPVRMQVQNKSGGSGAVAAAYLAEKKDDPHTIGLVTSVWIANALTRKEAKVTIHDLKPIAQLMLEPALFVVRADSPYKTLKDFVDAAKSKPGQLKQSGGSPTSRDNIVRQQLEAATGAKWAFVSFPGGGERLAALLGGHVDIMVIEPQEAGEQIRAGKLRPLAQLTEKRLAAYPDTPTLREAGFDVTPTPQIRGVVGPPQMPAEAAAYWEGVFDKLRQTASWKKYIADNQLEDHFVPGAKFKASIEETSNQLKEQFVKAGVQVVR